MTHSQSIKNKTEFRQKGSLAIAATLVVAGMSGCDGIRVKDAYAALQIKQAQVLGTDCTVPAEPTPLYFSGGRLDVALPDGISRPYKLPLSIFNAMTSVGKSPAEEMNNITLESFTVELSGDWYNSMGISSAIGWNDDYCPQKFNNPIGTVRIGPGGYAGAMLDALQAGHAYCLRQLAQFYSAEVTATVTARGRHGGTSIQSAPFKFQIQICKGCLQTEYMVPEIDRLNGALPQCQGMEANQFKGGCNTGQDSKVLCCSLKAQNPAPSEVRCPAVPMYIPDAGAP